MYLISYKSNTSGIQQLTATLIQSTQKLSAGPNASTARQLRDTPQPRIAKDLPAEGKLDKTNTRT